MSQATVGNNFQKLILLIPCSCGNKGDRGRDKAHWGKTRQQKQLSLLGLHQLTCCTLSFGDLCVSCKESLVHFARAKTHV